MALPGPDEDHKSGDPGPALRRARQLPRGAAPQGGWYSLISRHGGGSPEAMKRQIWRNYRVGEKTALIEDLLDRGVLADGRRVSKQPGRCCVTGCEVPPLPSAAE